ncbi:hypothetical protein T439DRAFT_366312 [Meredithblackwellia eburnea MCA 4105]
MVDIANPQELPSARPQTQEEWDNFVRQYEAEKRRRAEVEREIQQLQQQQQQQQQQERQPLQEQQPQDPLIRALAANQISNGNLIAKCHVGCCSSSKKVKPPMRCFSEKKKITGKYQLEKWFSRVCLHKMAHLPATCTVVLVSRIQMQSLLYFWPSPHFGCVEHRPSRPLGGGEATPSQHSRAQLTAQSPSPLPPLPSDGSPLEPFQVPPSGRTPAEQVNPLGLTYD